LSTTPTRHRRRHRRLQRPAPSLAEIRDRLPETCPVWVEGVRGLAGGLDLRHGRGEPGHASRPGPGGAPGSVDPRGSIGAGSLAPGGYG
jgi:hypothetical protein